MTAVGTWRIFMRHVKRQELRSAPWHIIPIPWTVIFRNRRDAIRHLKKVIAFSEKLGIGMVTTFVGGDQTKSVEENLRGIWPDMASNYQYAEEHGVRIAIENCPMLFEENSGGGHNLFYTPPALWRKCLI